MRISHRHRFVFFSNPKTGSESVRSLLDPYSDICGVPMWEMTAENPFYSHISPREVANCSPSATGPTTTTVASRSCETRGRDWFLCTR